MPLVVGIAFHTAARIYTFDPGELDLRPGERVVAETSRGPEVGEVKYAPRELAADRLPQLLKRVLRRVTPEDLSVEEANARRAAQALTVCRERVRVRALPMKLLRAEFAFDRSQVTIYFEAEGRVDFRELVKDLAGQIRTRIQLHQIGARDAAKLLGGIGPCGRALCCTTWLTDFHPVSMRMAKEQSLFLNPTKFSGVCGKLMCCLRYEYDHYRETRARLPAAGSEVMTPDGPGRVVDQIVIKEAVIVALRDGPEKEYPAAVVERPVVRGCSVLAGGQCSGGCGTPRPAPEE